MQLEPVNIDVHGFTCICQNCQKVIGGFRNEDEPRFADLHGEPFASYYCIECAKIIDSSVIRKEE